jgi:hypothetical protein
LNSFEFVQLAGCAQDRFAQPVPPLPSWLSNIYKNKLSPKLQQLNRLPNLSAFFDEGVSVSESRYLLTAYQ